MVAFVASLFLVTLAERKLVGFWVSTAVCLY
jgi:hypothetical protein